MATSKEEIEARLKTIDINTDGEMYFAVTEDIFERINESLKNTVKSMEKNPSLFSRTAKFWGELPLWQKILGGVAITLPTLIIGIAAQIGVLLAICGVTAITYAGGGIILDNHHNCSVSVTQSLEKGIVELAGVLKLTINALGSIWLKLKEELAKFANENERLRNNVNVISAQIDKIDVQVRAAAQMTDTLGETKEELVQTVASFQDGVRQQTDLFAMSEEKLNRIREAYDASREELTQLLVKIKEKEQELKEVVENGRLMVSIIQASAMELIKLSNTSAEQQNAYEQKLHSFIHDENAFNKIAVDISETGKKLVEVQKKLDEANARHQALLDIQERHVGRLEVISQSRSERRRFSLDTASRYDNRFYSITKTQDETENQTIGEQEKNLVPLVSFR